MTPAHAAPAPPDPAPYSPENVTDTVTITEQTWDSKRRPISTVTYGAETEGQTLGSPTEAGTVTTLASGGTSSASGCRKVTIYYLQENVVKFDLYKYTEWTSWCWTRSSQTVKSVSTDWSVKPSTFVGWEGTVKTETDFYDYSTNDGHPQSAYKHYRQGHLKYNFSPFYNYYPELLIRSYYNGTYVWEANK